MVGVPERYSDVYWAQLKVARQLDCSLAVAFASMQNRAEAADETVEEVARRVLAGQLRFGE